jgi:hypothetical protein
MLAGGTSSYIFFGKGFQFFSLISLAGEMYGVRYSWVACERMIVIRLQDLASFLNRRREICQSESCWWEEY